MSTHDSRPGPDANGNLPHEFISRRLKLGGANQAEKGRYGMVGASTTDAFEWFPGDRPGSLSTDGGERATRCSLLMGDD